MKHIHLLLTETKMKTNGFLKKDFWGLGILAQFFIQPKNKNKSFSFEKLKKEISSDDYREKVRLLIRRDLLLRYNSETVERGLENFNIQISAENLSHLEEVKKEEVSTQEASTPVEKVKEYLVEEKHQEVWKEVKEEEPVEIQEQPTPVIRRNEILTDEKQQEIWKVQSRIPKWFKNPNQYNSQILIAYMNLLGENKSVPLYKLESECRNIKTFKNNYPQMKIISDHNHAKVFEETGGRVTLWEPVREFVKQEFKKFKNRNNYY